MKTKKGFTIIEVVLVLAIAGLIFLMVFIALPALQRSQRDTQRRNDMARVATAITQYQANNNGLPIFTSSQGYSCSVGTGTSASGAINPKDSTTYESNAACKFIAQYMNSSSASTNEFKDPDGTAYGIVFVNYTNQTSFDNYVAKLPSNINHRIYVFINANCNGEKPEFTGNKGNYAIVYKLEGAGTYCSDNK